MKLASLHLKAFGPFTDKVLDFGGPVKSLVVVAGPNEAGKSAMLRAIEALRFQIDRSSKDNFLHDYAEMCVGGTFIDPQGGEASVMRFKKLKDPLRLAVRSADGRLQATDKPAPSALQDQLTALLNAEEYQRMFGLDHERLRSGGQRLAQGEEVGVSLFEASLGVRDVAAIGQELDAKARELFMPGARASKGRINEALRRYKELQQKVKQETIRPREWQERHNASERARQEVLRLDKEQRELIARQKLLTMLRGAAPNITELSVAEGILKELGELPELAEDAAEQRTASTANLVNARDALADALDAEKEAQERLDLSEPDAAVIQQSSAITRLAAKAEEVDVLRRTIAQLEEQSTAYDAELEALASKIDASATVEAVVALTPGKARVAQVEQRLEHYKQAEQSLLNHAQSAPKETEEGGFEERPTPSELQIRHLRQALAELERERNVLVRLRALPSEIEDAESALGQAVHDLDLAGEDELDAVRPVLDADIDEAAKNLQENLTGQQGLRDRIEQLERALESARAVRDRMRNDQAVVTLDDVLESREKRDQSWRVIRSTYVGEQAARSESTPSATTASSGALAEAYEAAVDEADKRADGYALNTEAAAELKGKQEEIGRYESDLAALNELLDLLVHAHQEWVEGWRQRLAEYGLTERAPLALREWQRLLKQARDESAALQKLRAEHLRALATASQLASGLRLAILTIDPYAIDQQAPLASLETAARDQSSVIQQREQANNARTARQRLLASQSEQRAARQTALEQALADAGAQLAVCTQELRLARDTVPTAIRAQLTEFDGLREAHGLSQQTKGKLTEARASLAQITADAIRLAGVLAVELQEGAEHLRPFFDMLEQRLERERKLLTSHQAATRDLHAAQNAARAQEALIDRHESRLKALCDAAGVGQSGLLPEIEARVSRRQTALATRERCLQQLQAMSDLSLAELREQLLTEDVAELQSLAEQCSRDLDALAIKLDAARAEADNARHKLDEIDASDTVAESQEALSQTSAAIEANLKPWMRLRLAHSLLMEAQRRFQERAQGPMLERASGYFQLMTNGAFARLKSREDDARQVLVAERAQGGAIGMEAMSEGTRDQLYLALRLAAVSLRREAGVDLPMVLDDVLMTSSDGRAGCVLQALADFSKGSQVFVFTHHHHLLDVARRHVPSDVLHVLEL